MFGRERGVRTVAIASLVLAAMAITGCVDEVAFFIAQNQIATSGADGCTPGTSDTEFRARGVLDVSAGQGYLLFPLLKLELDPSEAKGPERNRFVVRQFNVGLDMSEFPSAFPETLTSFSVASSGVIEPGSSRATVVKIIPDQLAGMMATQLPAGVRPTVVATTKAVAVRLGTDSEIESAEFRYPVEICNGCLVTQLAECPTGEAASGVVSNVCGLPQDSPVTCCTQNGTQVCLAGASN